MKSKRKGMFVAGGVGILLLLTIAAASEPVRTALGVMFQGAGRGPKAVSNEQTAPDLEQRVRARHGWNTNVQNTVITGQITFYDREGKERGDAKLTLSRAYPDRLRVVIQRGALQETVGFDREQAWKSGAKSLSEVEARNIRGWLRVWPERLFTLRGGGAQYREAGKTLQDFRPSTPWRAAVQMEQPEELDQIVIQDTIGLAPDDKRAGDRMSIYYSIDQGNLIRSVRWLEPDDPRARAEDQRAAKIERRIDFGNWLQMGGVMWPMEITQWSGGRVEFRIEVDEVKVNQPLADSIYRSL